MPLFDPNQPRKSPGGGHFGGPEMDDLRERLRRLGVTSGRSFTPRPRGGRGGEIDELVEGEQLSGADGACFRVVHRHAAATPHGQRPLGEWLQQRAEVLASLGDEAALAAAPLDRFIFLDTETTGLGGGAFAFLVGVGFFTAAGEFEIRQYFLRDPAGEGVLLQALAEDLAGEPALVTFNGRTFDVPLLASRYVMARLRSQVAMLPNLDLLHPARRLWRRRLPSCALSALEVDVLGVHRTEEDVPGALIPTMYRQYLQTRDARDMVRVLYHNEIDLLSMVTLGVTLHHAFSADDTAGLPIDDQISLARWYASRGLLAQAEAAYRRAADAAPDAERRYEALTGLALLLKRADRRAEAVPLWADVADLKLDVLGHEELAKYYEWHATDLAQALAWTEAGLRLAESWRPGYRRTRAVAELSHRRARLLRKLSGDDDPDLAEER